jgi:hypothetical protein
MLCGENYDFNIKNDFSDTFFPSHLYSKYITKVIKSLWEKILPSCILFKAQAIPIPCKLFFAYEMLFVKSEVKHSVQSDSFYCS